MTPMKGFETSLGKGMSWEDGAGLAGVTVTALLKLEK